MTKRSIDELLDVMAALRDPNGGCPWDLVQTFETVAPYTVEEAYEVAEAIARDDMGDLADELGDLLLQVVFHAQMAREASHFEFADVVGAIVDKMVRRHPHVFADAVVADAADQTTAWEEHKAAERAARTQSDRPPSALDGVTPGLPALKRALKLQGRAARVGFDWPGPADVVPKIREELDELDEVIRDAGPRESLTAELGDLLFTVVNLARHLGVDPDAALMRTNAKFERRFRLVEEQARADGVDLARAGIERLDRLWDQAKGKE